MFAKDIFCIQRYELLSEKPKPPPDFSTNYEEKPSFSDGFLS